MNKSKKIAILSAFALMHISNSYSMLSVAKRIIKKPTARSFNSKMKLSVNPGQHKELIGILEQKVVECGQIIQRNEQLAFRLEKQTSLAMKAQSLITEDLETVKNNPHNNSYILNDWIETLISIDHLESKLQENKGQIKE